MRAWHTNRLVTVFHDLHKGGNMMNLEERTATHTESGSIQDPTQSSVNASRRKLLVGGAAMIAMAGAPIGSPASASKSPATSDMRGDGQRKETPDTLTTRDGTKIYFKDWGTGQPIVFSHGWPLTADAWDAQMLFLGEHGYRVIAHDRRGHGRSSQPRNGNDMDTYSDDLAELFEFLDLKKAITW